MLQFTPDFEWDQARIDVRYTIATLRASGLHASLIEPLVALADQWSEHELERQIACELVDEANAVTAWLDEALDLAMKRFEARLAGALGTRSHDLYLTFFPERSCDAIDAALAHRCDRVAAWGAVRDRGEVPAALKEVLDDVAAIEARGRAALAVCREVLSAHASNTLKIQAWKGAADSVRRATEAALDQHASAHKFPRDYSDRFFLRAARPRAKRPAPQLGPAARASLAAPSLR